MHGCYKLFDHRIWFTSAISPSHFGTERPAVSSDWSPNGFHFPWRQQRTSAWPGTSRTQQLRCPWATATSKPDGSPMLKSVVVTLLQSSRLPGIEFTRGLPPSFANLLLSHCMLATNNSSNSHDISPLNYIIVFFFFGGFKLVGFQVCSTFKVIILSLFPHSCWKRKKTLFTTNHWAHFEKIHEATIRPLIVTMN
jgi:hypothetical protein